MPLLANCVLVMATGTRGIPRGQSVGQVKSVDFPLALFSITYYTEFSE